MAKTTYFTHKGERYVLEHDGCKDAYWHLMRRMGEQMYRPMMEWLAADKRKSALIAMVKSGELK